MSSTVERIIEICKAKNIPVSRLEKDLGYGNGFLNPKKVSDLKAGRLFEILDYLGVPLNEFIIDGKEKPATSGDGDDEKHKLVNSLFDQCPPEAQTLVINFLKTQAQQKQVQDALPESD